MISTFGIIKTPPSRASAVSLPIPMRINRCSFKQISIGVEKTQLRFSENGLT